MLRQRLNSSSKLRKSFALIIVACVMIIFFVGMDDIRAKVRDNKRKADLSEIAKALELYYDRYGSYPEVMDDDWQGWDASYEPEGQQFEFLRVLTQRGILSADPKDPYNDASYFYRYRHFKEGEYGCNDPYYILQVVNFETVQDQHGSGHCPEKDFTKDLPNGYTVMGIE